MGKYKRSRKAKKEARKSFEQMAARPKSQSDVKQDDGANHMPKWLVGLLGGIAALATALTAFTTIFGPLPELVSCARREVLPCEASFMTDADGVPRPLSQASFSSYARSIGKGSERIRLMDPKKPGAIDGVYWLDSACNAEVTLHNNRDEEVLVKRMRIIAEDVVPDEAPYFMVSMADQPRVDRKGPGQFTQSGVGIKVVNEGWGDAADVTLHVRFYETDADYMEMDDDEDPTYFLGTTTLDIPVGNLASKKTADVVVLTHEDLVEKPKDNRAIGMEVTATDADDREVKCGLGSFAIGFFIDADGYFRPFSYGADIPYVAGVLLNANVSSSEYEIDVTYDIAPGANDRIPVYFFPNTSCYASVRVEFDIGDGRGNDLRTVSTESERFHFFVSSVFRYPIVIPLNDLEGMELEEVLEQNKAAIVSFPWGNGEA